MALCLFMSGKTRLHIENKPKGSSKKGHGYLRNLPYIDFEWTRFYFHTEEERRTFYLKCTVLVYWAETGEAVLHAHIQETGKWLGYPDFAVQAFCEGRTEHGCSYKDFAFAYAPEDKERVLRYMQALVGDLSEVVLDERLGGMRKQIGRKPQPNFSNGDLRRLGYCPKAIARWQRICPNPIRHSVDSRGVLVKR